MFNFHDFGLLSDGVIDLKIAVKITNDPDEGLAPAYGFDICPTGESKSAGRLYLRMVESSYVKLYAGHIGYGVSPKFQGQRFAARACSLIKPVALHHGFVELWITCNPDNWPSRKTCEIIGATLVEIIDVDPKTPIYQDGEHQKCRYLWKLA
jgi:tagatose 1,6-diphosphate aldolase